MNDNAVLAVIWIAVSLAILVMVHTISDYHTFKNLSMGCEYTHKIENKNHE